MLSLYIVIMTRKIALLRIYFFKVQVVTGFLFIIEDRLTIKKKPHLINMMLSNLSELQTVILFHGRIFKKMHI
jgi:hypothetical protein